MTDISDLYPSSPADVPADYTSPTGRYQAQVLLVLLCLFVFVVAYLALTVGTAYLCYYCFAKLAEPEPSVVATATPPSSPPQKTRSGRSTPSGRNTRSSRSEKPVFWLLVGGVTSGLICLFFLKGLLKRSRSDPGVRVEVNEQEQPVLFAFISRLCRDTRSAFPHRIFLVPDVNAAVAFDESFRNLLFPSRKNLIIGLGLVNRLNLTEFKAVLAHEFGHFSQNSMKLGSYVYTANRVVADMVYGRDWLDDVVATMRRIDIRIAVFAWAFTAILWTLRKGLEMMFRGINFANVSLSRQMEYNADLVAVSVTGSDPLIFALGRLDFASETLGQAWNDLKTAADHGHFSRDLYFHQTRAAEYLRSRRTDAKLGEVPALPDNPNETVQVFKPEDISVPTMWATHPANHDRELNAKRRYLRGPQDERSAWELFADQATVCEAVTLQVYVKARKEEPQFLEEPEEVQAFIDTEHAETTYDPRYCGVFDNRYIKPGDIADRSAEVIRGEFEMPERLAAAHARLIDGSLLERMKAHHARHDEVNRLAGIVHGAVALTNQDFEHRGNRFGRADAPRLLKEVETELERDYEWMHKLDGEMFRIHYAMARQLGGAEGKQLEDWYRFHLAVQELRATLVSHSNHVQETLTHIAGQREIAAHEFQNALGVLQDAHHTLYLQLKRATDLHLPALANVTAGDPLRPLLFKQKLIRKLPDNARSLDGAWIQEFMNQLGEVIDKSARILFKSLGGLLRSQERLADEWKMRYATEPSPAKHDG